MAFNAVFYTFSKKERSTATPSSGGTTYSCTADQPLDVLSPVIRLSAGSSPVAFNYCHISDFSRWYFVTGWTFTEGLWQASLRVDALASWKTEIGNSSLYVYRAAAASDGTIVDPVYPTVAKYDKVNVSMLKLWTVDGDSSLATRGNGMFVLGIIGNGKTRYYGFTSANLDTFLQAIFSDNYYSAVLGYFNALEYVEAKVAINPLQYISSVRFYPTAFMAAGTAGAFNFNAVISSIPVGPVSVSATAVTFEAVGAYPDRASYNAISYTINKSSSFNHPQAATRGVYLQLAPYTQVEVFCPPWGTFQLNGADLIDATDLSVTVALDLRSGTGTLSIYAVYSATKSQLIARSTTMIGIDCPLSAIVTPGFNIGSGLRQGSAIMEAAVAVASGRPSALFGPDGFIGRAAQNEIPHLFTAGGQGSGSEMSGDPQIQLTFRYVVDEDNASLGRPLCKIRTLNTLAGFQQAEPDDMQLSCTDAEAVEIREAVKAGYFYE